MMRRRVVLGLLVGGAPGALAPACAPPKRPDRRVRVPLQKLRAAGRLEVEYLGDPIELRAAPEGPVARSLLCTHFGCRVQWDAAAGVYECPCHQARFDADGRPVAGPARRPLRGLRVAVEGGDVLAGEP
jgi:Rieske Fe-S protein